LTAIHLGAGLLNMRPRDLENGIPILKPEPTS
jgi:hypothetical protein